MNELSEDKKAANSWKPLLRQGYLTSSVCLNFFVSGLGIGTPTVAIPLLRKEANSASAVSDEMASWISSVSGFSSIIWTVVLATLLSYFGNKKILLLVVTNSMVDFILLYYCRNAIDLLVFGIILGMTSAANLTVCILIITECSSPKYRGMFLSLKSATFYWGVWVANAIGALTDFRNIGMLGIICNIYILISVFIMPESPLWLAKKEKYVECATSHRWLKGEDEDMKKELEVLINTQKDSKKCRNRKKTLRHKISATLRNIIKPEMYKPFLISSLLTCMYHGSGKLVYTVYSIEIIKKITKSQSAAIIGMLVLDGVSIAGMYFGSGLAKILKRRTLTLTGSFIASLFLFSLSIYLFLIKYNLLIQNTFITLTLLTGFSLAICSGPMIMLYAVHAEVMPIISRNFYAAVVGCVTYLFLGLTLKLSPYIFRSLGHEGTFLFFALFSFAMLILVFIYLPETKDKTLHEIADIFKNKKIVANLVDRIDQTELELLPNNSTVIK